MAPPRDVTHTGVTVVLDRAWHDHDEEQQRHVLAAVDRALRAALGINVPAALVHVEPRTADDPERPGERAHTLEAGVWVPRPLLLPSAAPVYREVMEEERARVSDRLGGWLRG